MKNLVKSMIEASSTPPWHEGARADDSISAAYNSLVSLKMGFDRMHEIPTQYNALYREIGNALSAISNAKNATNQVREMVKKTLLSVSR